MPSVQKKPDVLALRRKAMTRARGGATFKTIEVVEFMLGAQSYAFALDQIREIAPLSGLSYIPGAPDFAPGVINMRGEIVSVVDLQAFLGLDTSHKAVNPAKKGDARAIVFQKGALIVGFVADEVIGAEKIPEALLQHAVETICGINAEYVSAVTADRMVILDAARLLADPRLNPRVEQPQ